MINSLFSNSEIIYGSISDNKAFLSLIASTIKCFCDYWLQTIKILWYVIASECKHSKVSLRVSIFESDTSKVLIPRLIRSHRVLRDRTVRRPSRIVRSRGVVLRTKPTGSAKVRPSTQTSVPRMFGSVGNPGALIGSCVLLSDVFGPLLIYLFGAFRSFSCGFPPDGSIPVVLLHFSGGWDSSSGVSGVIVGVIWVLSSVLMLLTAGVIPWAGSRTLIGCCVLLADVFFVAGAAVDKISFCGGWLRSKISFCGCEFSSKILGWLSGPRLSDAVCFNSVWLIG